MFAYDKVIVIAEDAERAVTLLGQEGFEVKDEKLEKIGPSENLRIIDGPGGSIEVEKASFWIDELGHGVHGDL